MFKQALLLINTKLFKSARKRARELTSDGPSEDDITVEFANSLRSLSLENKFKGIWVHVPNEVSDNKNKIFGLNLLAKGKIPGMADFIFIRPGKGILIELKTPKGKLSENQKNVQKWCEEQQVIYRVARSCTEGLNILNEEGFF